MDFSSVHNAQESAVFDAVAKSATRLADWDGATDQLADVACVALNRLPPRYIRHDVDLAFFQTEQELIDWQGAIDEVVTFAFAFVKSRQALGQRG